MERYRFIVFDDHKVIADSRDYPASNDDTAIQLAEGWRDDRGGQVWRGPKLLKHWKSTRPKPVGKSDS